MADFKGRHNRDDQFVGTDQADTFTFAVRDFNERDSIEGAGGFDTLVFSGHGKVDLANAVDIEAVRLGDGGVTVVYDRTFGTNGLSITGGAGADTFVVGDTVWDRVSEATTTPYQFNAGDGVDTLRYAGGNGNGPMLFFELQNRTDQLTAPGAVVRNFENVDFAGYNERIAVTGSNANNVLVGSFYGDTLDGGFGDDVLDGGATQLDYRDTLTGGHGRDTFRFSARGSDYDDFYNGGAKLTDFDPSEDRLQFARGQFGINGKAFDTFIIVADAHARISRADVVYYDNVLSDGDAVKEYLSEARGGTVGRGIFVLALNDAHHTILYHAEDASFTKSHDLTVVADLGDVGVPHQVPLSDFSFF